MWKTTMARREDQVREWYLVDASKYPLGRMAVKIALRLMGKDKPEWTPHVDTGAGVIVINASKVQLSGKKKGAKVYQRYSGYPGGRREIPFRIQIEKDPARVVRHAVRLMLPKNNLGRLMLKKLRVYPGPEHPHAAQNPKEMEIQ